MKKYKLNIQDYIESEFLAEETYKLGDELSFLPAEEIEANFCKIDSVVPSGEDFNVTFAIENEWTGERYKKSYQVKQGSKIDMNMLTPNLACFLPPNKVPALVEVTSISIESISLKTVGILEEYVADINKKTTESKEKA